MLRLLQVIFRDSFKDDFKTTKLNSTQLGTTQPQLVVAKLIFNFNFNLVERWDSINFVKSSTHPPGLVVNSNYNYNVIYIIQFI